MSHLLITFTQLTEKFCTNLVQSMPHRAFDVGHFINCYCGAIQWQLLSISGATLAYVTAGNVAHAMLAYTAHFKACTAFKGPYPSYESHEYPTKNALCQSGQAGVVTKSALGSFLQSYTLLFGVLGLESGHSAHPVLHLCTS